MGRKGKRKGSAVREHRDGKSRASTGALVCAHCGGFIVVGTVAPGPMFCSGRWQSFKLVGGPSGTDAVDPPTRGRRGRRAVRQALAAPPAG
jgi:hypothetical protein